MKYHATFIRKYHYIRVFGVLKKKNDNVNPLSRALASFVDKLIAKRSRTGGQ